METGFSILGFGFCLGAWLAPLPAAAAPAWFKGNTHTHTTMSDGDSPPETVIQWYKDHGYRFLVLSDHNVFTEPAKYASFNAADFLLVSGEEVTDRFEKAPIHVNALGIRKVIPPQHGASADQVLQRNVDAIRAEGAVPHINHPNFHWAVTAEMLEHVRHDRLFEIYNGHPAAFNEGDATHPSLEAMWDQLLTHGKRLYGIAVDDAHHFKTWGPNRSNPGRGWVVVRAERLEAGALLSAMERGDFYASTGVTLDTVDASPAGFAIRIRAEAGKTYTVRFIGPEGKMLRETSENPARFEIPPGTLYTRAKVTASDGAAAWVQPVFPGGAPGMEGAAKPNAGEPKGAAAEAK